jgi:hypothetical protein
VARARWEGEGGSRGGGGGAQHNTHKEECLHNNPLTIVCICAQKSTLRQQLFLAAPLY